jgi:hypothetical protein
VNSDSRMTFRELFEELKVNQKLIQRLFDVQLIGNRINHYQHWFYGVGRIENAKRRLKDEAYEYVTNIDYQVCYNDFRQYLHDETDARYSEYMIDILFHIRQEERIDVLDDLLYFATQYFILDSHFDNTIEEILTIPQLSWCHNDAKLILRNAKNYLLLDKSKSARFGILCYMLKDTSFHSE